ncbi:NAD(P)/FAD-dependent oxidoreductase [Aequorivita echinoideorum]|uniref:FAD-dependent monooxygenase n=1 Tax=Aequorivita echinoideorum TaxID=1549647 RepID=A0ABS5S640_9FLAO|nr:FAD-dependent oxidoreductase [Aequorivita echinoideorum]MBT0608686.1 FAD-dependent monooxygenase [Aequorivita echinoideorum]
MELSTNYEIIIVGGGLAGLVAALHLSKQNCNVLLLERHPYPHHKVCGEYVSNEVLAYLSQLGIDPFVVGATKISNFEMSDVNGRLLKCELPLGGFGISRYSFDNLIYRTLKNYGKVAFETVEKINFQNDSFEVITQSKKKFISNYVLGAFGKRSNLDAFLNRDFFEIPATWLAVKGHFDYDFLTNSVALHNFEGGYCGLSRVEDTIVNACYLTTLKSFKKHGDVSNFQKNCLSKNPYLNQFFNNAKPIFDRPMTISQISFESKKPVENHIFMVGDSAGLIHPLCGNGMAMAIHGAKIFSELYLKSKKENWDRARLEKQYALSWNQYFKNRLKTGRYIQRALLNPVSLKIGFAVAKLFPTMLTSIIRNTHGKKSI